MGDPQWYKDAVIYELHVRAFYDSDADGIGDFKGLAEKVDYLQDLGVTAIWLLPFYPSPLRDDGYDTADYLGVHPAYGTLRDFRLFLREAHRRGLRVITELVLNHTSDQHPWFQRARRAPAGSPLRDFYVWSDTEERYREARIIFKDFEHSNWAWDPLARAYYWHRFYAHQPDLNWANPQVQRAMRQVIDFWLGELGVDGLRLDAVPYLFERDGTNCENLPETHQALKELRRYLDESYGDRMLLAEANQWPEDAVAYFGQGDECHTAFHFPLMPRLFMGLRTEDRYPIVDMLEQTPAIPESAQWVLFLRNHDELTLEMVTDEERDYMYRVYAQDQQARINLGIRRRLAPLLGNSRRKIELMNGLLLSLPGTPVLYYGDELGMGDNFYLGDRNGVRTPMQWSSDRNAGFSRANAQRLFLPVIADPEYHYEAVNVEVQQGNPQSLLWWTKRILALRRRYRAFGRGRFDFVYPDNPKVLAYARTLGEEKLLVVANLSRHAEHAILDLSPWKGLVPVELFGHSEFPPISERPYPLALGPHGFYWFALKPPLGLAAVATQREDLPAVAVREDWRELVEEDGGRALGDALAHFLQGRPWYFGRNRTPQSVTVADWVDLDGAGLLALVRVEYTAGEPETYQVPLAFGPGKRVQDHAALLPHAVARVAGPEGELGVLYDAVYDPRFCDALLQAFSRSRTLRASHGEARVVAERELRRLPRKEGLAATLLAPESGNPHVDYGGRFVLKLVRRVEEGLHPDVEVGAFLARQGQFTQVRPVVGALEHVAGHAPPMTLAIVHRAVAHEGSAWRYTQSFLERYFERILSERRTGAPLLPAEPLLSLAREPLPELALDLLGPYAASAEILGRRTAELHLALAASGDDPDFAPEPFTTLYARSLMQSARNLTRSVFQLLRRNLGRLPEADRREAEAVLPREDEVLRRAQAAFQRRLSGLRLRRHGDYDLTHLLYTGRDFVIASFEGDPKRSLSERRLKRSPLRDVASLVRSFQYAGELALRERTERGQVRPEDLAALEPWVRCWDTWAAAAMVRAYLAAGAGAAFLPTSDEETSALLTAYALEKSLREVAHEMVHRLDWVHIPLRGVRRLLDVPEPAGP